MTFVKSAPKKSYAQKTDFFTKVICTFLKLVRKDGFFDAPFDLCKEKKFSFHLLEGTMNLFEELKWSKMEETAQDFEKRFFISRS
jgi:hypothetical protein